VSDFRDRFASVLGESHRWNSFNLINDRMAALARPVRIVETGCARQENNWGGDGQSTQLWNWMAETYGGTVRSFDIDPGHCAYAKSVAPLVEVYCQDSVTGLRQYEKTEEIDFLYLDSMDCGDGIASPLHHLAELASVYERLPSGCLIAVDDCVGGYGKGVLVDALLTILDVQPIRRDYVTVWVKP
jgi:hypothetical protein